jgi:hypothetical protein
MSVSLVDFIDQLSNIVRPNKFLVYITPPTGLLETDVDSNVMKFYVQSATIPDRTFGDIEMKFFGMTYKLPGNESISDLTITFINDNEWEMRDFFESWAENINERDTSIKGYARELFTGTSIVVKQLGFSGEVLANYRFYNVFPKTVAEIALSMDSTDSHETFDVTFDYSYFKQEDVDEE